LRVSALTDQWLQVVVVCITASAALFALLNVLVNARNERRRSQPIVVAHEFKAAPLHGVASGGLLGRGRLPHHEGSGPAFNVRFGVEFGGVRYPFRMTVQDPDSGNVQRVLRSGGRRPEAGAWPVLIDSMSMWDLGAAAEAARVRGI
jgi:hypothetical protein